VNQINYLKVTINGVQQYIDISTPTATFPSNAQFQDAQTLQPFSLAANENKQIWITTHIPNTTPAGDYYGDIIVTSPSGSPVIMNFKVTVLPFELEPSPLEYAIYYIGQLTSTPPQSVNANYKTTAQYTLELQDMKDHGISYPTMSQDDWDMWNNRVIPETPKWVANRSYLY